MCRCRNGQWKTQKLSAINVKSLHICDINLRKPPKRHTCSVVVPTATDSASASRKSQLPKSPFDEAFTAKRQQQSDHKTWNNPPKSSGLWSGGGFSALLCWHGIWSLTAVHFLERYKSPSWRFVLRRSLVELIWFTMWFNSLPRIPDHLCPYVFSSNSCFCNLLIWGILCNHLHTHTVEGRYLRHGSVLSMFLVWDRP